MTDETIIFYDKEMPFKKRILYGMRGLIFGCALLAYICKTTIDINGFSYFILLCYLSTILLGIALYIDAAKVYISYLSQCKDCLTIKYSVFNKEYYLENISTDRMKFEITRPWYISDIPGYRMEIYIDKKKILTQERIGEWDKDKFDEIIKYQKDYAIAKRK